MPDAETSKLKTTAQLIEAMVAIRDERRAIGKRDKELIAEWRSLEMEMLVRLDEQGMEKASTAAGTASITEVTLPQVIDWDAFWEHIYTNEAGYLLQKRPAAAAFRELIDSGQTVPGIEPYVQRSIGLRKK